MEREIGADDAALILDGSAVPKQGKKTVGVKRQWSGHEGKVDNCVVGVHAVLTGQGDASCVVDSQLYLPREWTDDEAQRELAHLPDDVEYATITEIGLKMVQELSSQCRFAWVLGDTEFGRSQALRGGVRALGKAFAVEVPKDTQVARLRMDVTVHRATDSVENWGRQIRRSRFKDVFIRYGEKQPLTASAAAIPVWTREQEAAHRDVLLVLQRPDEPAPKYFLLNAPTGTSLETMVRMVSRRHRVEEVFEECKGEVGMDHFEVRAFHGWHHHMTLMAMSHWFLVRLKRELGKKFRPGITVSIIRQLISKILAPLATPEYMADWANRQMDRNDEVRDAHYRARGFPPMSRSQ
jgi:SRSO17 transposase